MIVFERFEGEQAILEQIDLCGQSHMQTVHRSCLPPNITEGTVLVETAQGLQVDEEATMLRKRQAITRFHWLKKR